MTVMELITASLRQIGELSPGQTPNAEEAAAGLVLLNNILQNWELARRKVFIIDQLLFPLTDGLEEYTMGPGGDFDNYRPVKIQSANFVTGDTRDPKEGIRHPLDLANSVEWASLQERRLAAQRPLKLYNDNDYPLLRLYLWPVPAEP